MARTIKQIQDSIVAAKTADSVLAGLSSTSMVAIWRLWTYVVAVCMWVQETAFDAHKAEVSAMIAALKPHSLQWYVQKAKAYQYGITLPDDSVTYALVPPADTAVLIVTNAAAVELGGVVRIKVAKGSAGALSPLSGGQLAAFTAYMNRVKDAGVRLQLTSGNADNLRLTTEVYYDPLILDNTGARLDGTSATPVKDAINAYLSSLPFNGLFVVNELMAYVRDNVEGVVIFSSPVVQANYGATPYVGVDVEYVPDAGYMALDDAWFDANVMYSAHAPI